MFDAPRFMQNSFHVFFTRQRDIRHKARIFEDILEDKYIPPLILPISDDSQPETPRIIFSSKNGYSRIAVTQVSIALDVQYSYEYQIDILKGKKYVLERVPVLFRLVGNLGVRVNFCGFTTLVSLQSKYSDRELVEHLSKTLITEMRDDLFDMELKTTSLDDERFYSNITTSNYRIWEMSAVPQVDTRVHSDEASERGVQIIGDYNDRYAYNHKRDYWSSEDIAGLLIDNGIERINQAIAKVEGVE